MRSPRRLACWADFPGYPERKLREFRTKTISRRGPCADRARCRHGPFLDDNVGRAAMLRYARLDTLVVYTSDHGDNLGTRTFWGKSNMRGSGRRAAHAKGRAPGRAAVATPASLVDAYPTMSGAR